MKIGVVAVFSVHNLNQLLHHLGMLGGNIVLCLQIVFQVAKLDFAFSRIRKLKTYEFPVFPPHCLFGAPFALIEFPVERSREIPSSFPNEMGTSERP